MNPQTAAGDDQKKLDDQYVDPALGTLLLGIVAASVAYFNYRPVTTYVATHWLYDYEFGFIERGLIGAFNRMIFGNIAFTYHFIFIASIILLLSLITILTIFCVICIRSTRQFSAVALSLILITSSGSLSFFAFDSGRFDTINYIIFIFIALFLRESEITPKACFIVGLLSSVCVLIHEPFFVIGVPPIFAMLCWRRVGFGVLVPFIIPVLCAAFAIELIGRPDIGVESYKSILAARADFEPHIWVIETFYRGTVQNIVYAWNYTKSQQDLWQYFLTIAVLLPGIAAVFMFMRPNLIFTLVSSAPPLVLLIIATDHGRWLALATFNFLFSSLWLLSLSPDLARQNPRIQHSVLILAAVIVLSLMFGHVAVELGYPSGFIPR